MLTTPHAILSANGQALLQPLGFSKKYRGKRITEIPDDYWKWLAKEAHIDYTALQAKIQEARTYKPSTTRPVVTDLSRVTPTLYEHQKAFQVRFGTQNYGAAFFDIGTGKTRTILEHMRLRWMPGDKALVLCPKSVFSSWQREIKAFTPHFSSITVAGTASQKLTYLSLKRDIYVTNYETLLSNQVLQALVEAGFTWLICDESHKVKSHSAQTTKRLINLSANIEMRFIMTGTPITNTEADIWSQSVILDRGATFGTSFSRFYNSYFTKGQYGWYQGEFIQSRDAAFKAAVASFSMRVLKHECLDLPKVLPDMIRDVELSGEALKYYRKMRDEALIVLKDKTIEARYKIVEMRRLHQICGGGIGPERFNCDKLDELMDVIDEIGRPVVVSAIYRDEIRAIVQAVKKSGRRVSYIAGDVTDKDRQERIRAFCARELDVIVLQQQAAGTGIDGLQRVCSNMVFFSWDHQWEAGQQMKGRIDRPGQEDHPQYIYLRAVLPMGKATIDDAIYKSHHEKTAKISELIDNVVKGAEE
jgi:SNF2 family DNA or RNA helicase